MPRGVNNNLIPGNERSHNEATENGKMGGIKSGISRRKKASIKTRMGILLGLKPNFEDMPDDLRAAIVMAGISLDEIESNDDLLLIAAFVRGLSDTATMKYIDELMGRNPQLEIKKKELQLKQKELKVKLAATQNGSNTTNDGFIEAITARSDMLDWSDDE